MADKRYNAFSDELKRIFGCRVQRISIDAGFTCPNRDGTVGREGCIFCGETGSGATGIVRERSVTEQILHGKEIMTRTYGARKFIAYFQPFTNTYGPVDRLRRLYEEALAVPDVVGLMVGSRPDCLPPDVLDLLAECHHCTWFWLELGLQSTVDRSLSFLNRGHDFARFADAAGRCRERGIRVTAHVILGIPGETREEMLATAGILNDLGIAGVKIHLLHVVRDTRLAGIYEENPFPLPEMDEYVELVCDFLERLDPMISIQRLTGDGGRNLVAPLWSRAKLQVLNAIDAELERRGSRQGSRL